MSEYCNKKSYPLRHSDFDFRDELKPSSLLALVQESAGVSADELGFGYEAMKALGYGFIIVNTYCELDRPVKLGETLTVETWPLPPRHVIFERDYRVLGSGGDICARVASRWCLVDLHEFALLAPDKLGETHANCPYRNEKTVEVPNWKIPKLGEEGREVYRLQIRNDHCDHYLHANNTRYADFFFDCFTMDELSQRRVKSFHIVYGKQAKEGAELVFYRKDCDENTVIIEARCLGEVFTQFRV
ncbi:MAG: hypothetical protein K2L87_02580, partial [Clostridiales bacterium]|nr:hypothetical protein [Clostridiales bacterium]